MLEHKWESILSQGCTSLSRQREAAVRTPSKNVHRLLMTELRLRWESKHLSRLTVTSVKCLSEKYKHKYSFCSCAHTQGTTVSTEGWPYRPGKPWSTSLCISAALPTHTLPLSLRVTEGRMGSPEWWMSYTSLLQSESRHTANYASRVTGQDPGK